MSLIALRRLIPITSVRLHGVMIVIVELLYHSAEIRLPYQLGQYHNLIIMFVPS